MLNKITKLSLRLIIAILFVSSGLYAQVNLSGFFDVQYKQSLSTQKQNNVELGQFEVGLQKSVSTNLNIEGAIAFDSEANNFILGSGYADFTISSDEKNDFGVSNILPNLGIMIGQYDVPFGIDYQCIPSPDRKMVSPPLAVQYSISCLNKLGIDFYGSAENYNFNLYVVNGFTNNLAFGGRIGILPYNELEIGYSYLSDLGSFQNINPRVSGADLDYHTEKFELKGEYIWSKGLSEGELDSSATNKINKGYYLQLTHFFEGPFEFPFTAGIRYGNWAANNFAADESNLNSIFRLTMVLGINVMKNVEVRTEYSRAKYGTNGRSNLLSMQLVLVF